jgi:hypothetical protein
MTDLEARSLIRILYSNLRADERELLRQPVETISSQYGQRRYVVTHEYGLHYSTSRRYDLDTDTPDVVVSIHQRHWRDGGGGGEACRLYAALDILGL